MSTQNALEKYTKAMEALEAHQEANKPVFDAHQKLVFALVDAENELRDAVAETNAGVENSDYKVTITPQTQTMVDPDDVRKLILDPALREKLIKTISRPPRITINKTKAVV